MAVNEVEAVRTVEVAAAWITLDDDILSMSEPRLSDVIVMPCSSSSVAEAECSSDVIRGGGASRCVC